MSLKSSIHPSSPHLYSPNLPDSSFISIPFEQPPATFTTSPTTAPPRLDAAYLHQLGTISTPIVCYLYCWSVEDEFGGRPELDRPTDTTATTDYEKLAGFVVHPDEELPDDPANCVYYRPGDRWCVSEWGEYDVDCDADEERNCRVDDYLRRTDGQRQQELAEAEQRRRELDELRQVRDEVEIRAREVAWLRTQDLEEEYLMREIVADLSQIEAIKDRVRAAARPTELLPELEAVLAEVTRKSLERRALSKRTKRRSQRQKEPLHFLRAQWEDGWHRSTWERNEKLCTLWENYARLRIHRKRVQRAYEGIVLWSAGR